MIFLYYVQESDKPKFWLKFFNAIELYEDKLILPVTESNEIDYKKAKIFSDKIKRILNKTGCKKICISKKIKQNKQFIENIKNNQIEIVCGKWLYMILKNEILEYILKKENMEKSKTTIAIVINKIDNECMFENIRKIIREYKNVNIVTNKIANFKKIEEQFEKEGILINVSNNKKKAFLRSNIILNIDFSNEQINQYNIPEKAIIVSENANIKINKKRFNGICINDYEIKYLNIDEFNYDKYSLYDQKDIYESQIYQKQPFEYIKRKLNRDKVQIDYLKGNKTIY